MKLYNVVKVFDVYCVAETPDAALEAVETFIREENEPVSEETALETTHERNIRAKWIEKSPFVGSDVSDEDFGRVKGKSTLQVFEMLHKRDPQQ